MWCYLLELWFSAPFCEKRDFWNLWKLRKSKSVVKFYSIDVISTVPNVFYALHGVLTHIWLSFSNQVEESVFKNLYFEIGEAKIVTTDTKWGRGITLQFETIQQNHSFFFCHFSQPDPKLLVNNFLWYSLFNKKKKSWSFRKPLDQLQLVTTWYYPKLIHPNIKFANDIRILIYQLS